MATKTCSKCRESKLLTSFSKHKYSPLGRRAECKDCVKLRSAKYYQKNKQAHRDRGTLKKILGMGFKQAPCSDCGGNYPTYCLQWDHIGEKSGDPATLLWGKGKETYLAEIQKCELVCANCHAVRTHRRRLTTLPEDLETYVEYLELLWKDVAKLALLRASREAA